MRRTRFVVHGLVQGVNFRATAAVQAQRLGLTGRIRNCDDGSVEAIAEGDERALAEFERWLGRGPRLAQVERVEVEPLAGERQHSRFAIE